MTRMRGLIAIGCFAASPVQAQDFTTPSGMAVIFGDIALEGAGVRVRFIAPDLGTRAFPTDVVAGYTTWICQTHIVPALEANDFGDTYVTLSLASELLPLGEFDPEIAQIFDGFFVADGICHWQLDPEAPFDEEPDVEGEEVD